MANRYFEQFTYSLEKQTVRLFGTINIGAAGAVASFKGGGIGGVVKETAAGTYSITLSDKYNRLLAVHATIVDNDISQITRIQVQEDPASVQSAFVGDNTFQIVCLAPTNASTTTLIAANPADGAQIMFEVVVRNTEVGRYD